MAETGGLGLKASLEDILPRLAGSASTEVIGRPTETAAPPTGKRRERKQPV